ncbi:unnamed protein product [Soboliphyme baturini]|uniref:Uncharacterized protein n=1 Tax=Soboliphyme baturini TaxID=241478 RepID=A0A183I9K8_9BILA|nr:unnamed protein product [Soboliphyme baturini]
MSSRRFRPSLETLCSERAKKVQTFTTTSRIKSV